MRNAFTNSLVGGFTPGGWERNGGQCMNRQTNGLPEDSVTRWQRLADDPAAKRETLYSLEGQHGHLEARLSSLADYSIRTLAGEAIR